MPASVNGTIVTRSIPNHFTVVEEIDYFLSSREIKAERLVQYLLPVSHSIRWFGDPSFAVYLVVNLSDLELLFNMRPETDPLFFLLICTKAMLQQCFSIGHQTAQNVEHIFGICPPEFDFNTHSKVLHPCFLYYLLSHQSPNQSIIPQIRHLKLAFQLKILQLKIPIPVEYDTWFLPFYYLKDDIISHCILALRRSSVTGYLSLPLETRQSDYHCPPLRKSEIEYYAMLDGVHHYNGHVLSYNLFDRNRQHQEVDRYKQDSCSSYNLDINIQQYRWIVTNPDIERTFRRRKKEQRNLQASTSSTMEEENVFLEELPFPGNPPDGRYKNDGLPPSLPPPPGGNGRNRLQDIQPRVAEPHVGPVPIIQEPGPQVQQENPVNGILRNSPPPLNNNRQIEDVEQHIFRLANSKDNSMMDYAIPIVHQLQTGIRDPTCNVPHFELKTVMFQMLQNNGQFAGLSKEDPHAHLRSFLEIAGSFRLRGISDDALKLKLFPFSLSHHARAWYNSLKPNSTFTWDQMAEVFLKKYFPPLRNAQSRNEVCTFRQDDDEAVPTAWERFKELLRKCPHHGIPYCIQLETFYNGLNYPTRQMLDATAGGAFTASSYNE
ncbi:hypothetical protein OSB04_024128 [Centaurea solstitialis]|uniref:Retrotransposon gag domain-containing protein n=1 Tax=Centaurea solstitialis TaxID=347529 RepID=A0AA38SX94_9ASTR|nr:hypothetical protein OSB04_024128 [Centaurea solstitialis]